MPTRPKTFTSGAGRFAVRTLEVAGNGLPRASPCARGYGWAWQKIRRQVLFANPVCRCGQPANEVDHILPLARGGTHDIANLQALCKACHSRKTVSEDGGFGFKRR